MASISLCMIAKNEERWIAQAINSVRPIISEIILVDTGSTDRTVEIVKSLGGQTYFMPWKDDFSAPRNLSLQHATGDWVLILDADEAIAQRDLQELVRLTQDTTRCVEFLQRHYSDDHRLSDFRPIVGEYPEWEKGQGGYFESNCVRMFPNHAGIHYRGKVHELVEHSIRDIGKHQIVRTDVRIHHYGHISEVKKEKDKSRIYTPLGQAKVREKPKDWKNFFELGVEHNNNGRLQESVDAFKIAAKMNPGYTPTWVNLGYVLCELKQYDQAIVSLRNALKVDPTEDEAYCNLGVVYMRMKNYQAAEQAFRRAIALNDVYVNAYCNLATCLAMTGRLAEAVNIYQRVLEMFPTCIKAHSEVGALYLSAKLYENAEHHLRRAAELGCDDARVFLHLGQLYKLVKRNADAVTCLRRFCQLEVERHQGNPPPDLRDFLQQVMRQCDALARQPSAPQTSPAPAQVQAQSKKIQPQQSEGGQPRKTLDKETVAKLVQFGEFDEQPQENKTLESKKKDPPPEPADKEKEKKSRGATKKKAEAKGKSAGGKKASTKKKSTSKKSQPKKKTQTKKKTQAKPKRRKK